MENSTKVYLDAYYNKKINAHAFLLEAGQGKNINGNMFAILKELKTNSRYQSYKVYFVVTKDTIEKAGARLSFYGYDDVELVERMSSQYLILLATCKYLITDNSFPPCYIHKDGQVMLNTWHGTPLKTLGRCDIENASSYSNIQKNFLTSDYILFPNVYTRDIFMEDYNLKNVGKNKILLADYPRNVAFFDDELEMKIRKEYNLEDKEILAYMPTWRGTGRNASINKQKEIVFEYLSQINSQLKENQVLYVNLHFLIGNAIDLSSLDKVFTFPSEYETYDFLNICDVLITDYSSVFFDFAVKRRKIVLFAYDLEEYTSSRGMYFPITDLPFPIVENVDDLMQAIHGEYDVDYDKFNSEYCTYENKDTVRNILDLLIEGKEDGVIVEDIPYNGKENVFIHVSKIEKSLHAQYILSYLETLNEDCNYIVLFSGKITPRVIETVKKIPANIQIYGYTTKYFMTRFENIAISIKFKTSLFDGLINKSIEECYRRECKRLFAYLRIDRVVHLLNHSRNISRILSCLDVCQKTVNVPDSVYGLRVNTGVFASNREFLNQYPHDSFVADLCDEEDLYYQSVAFYAVKHKIVNRTDDILICLKLYVRSIMELKDLKIVVGENEYELNSFQCKPVPFLKDIYAVKLSVAVKKDDLREMSINNSFHIVCREPGKQFVKNVRFEIFKNKKSKLMRPVFIGGQQCVYLKKTSKYNINLIVRNENVTDHRREYLKAKFAYYLSKFMKKKIILLYEKESSRYEESASVLYEYLIDAGYDNVYYILDRNALGYDEIDEKYKKHIINRYTFKHYLYFFMCRHFIGTEVMVHAFELRASMPEVLEKIQDPDHVQVFLQHGVMYMISLDSESRGFFQANSNLNHKVVVSSQLEAQHFIELGGYDPSQVYVTGLLKFDKNVWHEDADKIVVMPTWRPWEYNVVYNDFTASKYYQMLERIYDAIPVHLREKLIILPHPLFYSAMSHMDFELKKYMQFDVKYDDILKDTKVLITDYSSIAYDAFYRGANVIFYLEELDECLENYGPSTKLMMKENDVVFGDACYCKDDLARVIEDNYRLPQKAEYLDKYAKVVEYHDGKNTGRLLDCLKKDGIL